MKRIMMLIVWVLLDGVSFAAKPRNVFLIVADDLDWADTGCYGADLTETPHIDELATRSVRFSQAYAPAPVCSPTRAAMLRRMLPYR